MSRSADDVDKLIDAYVSRRIDRRTFLQRSFALGVSASALLAACGGEEEGAPPKLDTALLRIHLDEDIENLDPAIQPGHADGNVASSIFQNLVSFKPGTYDSVNELAEEWKGSEDGLRWDFTLKKGVQFHKGYGEMTAEDVRPAPHRLPFACSCTTSSRSRCRATRPPPTARSPSRAPSPIRCCAATSP